jgi:hypothetical protein
MVDHHELVMGHKYNEKNISCLHRVLPSSSSWVSPSENQSFFLSRCFWVQFLLYGLWSIICDYAKTISLVNWWKVCRKLFRQNSWKPMKNCCKAFKSVSKCDLIFSKFWNHLWSSQIRFPIKGSIFFIFFNCWIFKN